MNKHYCITEKGHSNTGVIIFLSSMLIFNIIGQAFSASQDQPRLRLKKMPNAREEIDLGAVPFMILYETYRNTNGSFN